jgi:hypothetical protein
MVIQNYPMKLANIYRFTPILLRQPSKKKHFDTGKGPFDWMPVGHIKKIHKNVDRRTHVTTPRRLHGNEMSCRIQHQTTPLEARMIVDLQRDHLQSKVGGKEKRT